MRVKVEVYLLSCTTNKGCRFGPIYGPFQFLDVTQQWSNGFKLEFILDFTSSNLVAKCTKRGAFHPVTAYQRSSLANRSVIYTFATVDVNWRNGSEFVTYSPIGLSVLIPKPKKSTRDFIKDWGNRLLPQPLTLLVEFFRLRDLPYEYGSNTINGKTLMATVEELREEGEKEYKEKEYKGVKRTNDGVEVTAESREEDEE
jgi:hypothetical protein